MNYDFYVNQYGGSIIPEADFKRLSNKAKAAMDYFTFNRIDWAEADDNIKICLCEVAEVVYQVENIAKNGVISSEAVGEYKISYDTKASSELITHQQSKAYLVVAKYLMHTGLMYRGNGYVQ